MCIDGRTPSKPEVRQATHSGGGVQINWVDSEVPREETEQSLEESSVSLVERRSYPEEVIRVFGSPHGSVQRIVDEYLFSEGVASYWKGRSDSLYRFIGSKPYGSY